MHKFYRIIDANINRASEGLRVLEDAARFHYDDKLVSGQIKTLRHKIRKDIKPILAHCLHARDAQNDIGLAVSKELQLDNKASLHELAAANCKRIQEALRSIEENLHLVDEYAMAKVYESYRFEAYTLEQEYFKLGCAIAKRKIFDTDLYCLTAEKFSCGRSNIEVVKAMLEAGIKIIQYREKDKKPLQKYQECLKIMELVKLADATFIVNDDVDIALMVKAHGIHIGQDDLPLAKVRELVGHEMLIGVSTHSPQQAEAAVKGGADYIAAGPLFKTHTKKDVCEPVGLEYLDYVVKNINIPFVAIGGIKVHNVAEVRARGAKCIGIVTEIVGAKDIKMQIENIRNKLQRARDY